MINVPPSYIGFGRLTEPIGASGCGLYVGLILVMQHIVCACNFAHVDQVLFFFRTVYPKVKESGTLSKAVVFCSQSLSAQKIIAMVWSCLGAPVSYYSYDAMYTINGQFHIGTAYTRGDQLMHFLAHEYQESFLWLLEGRLEMRFIDSKNVSM
jgi:hypothetical protein